MEGSLWGQLFFTGAKHKLVPGGVQLDDVKITVLFDGEIYKPKTVAAKASTVAYVTLCMHNGLYVYAPDALIKRFSYVIEKGVRRMLKQDAKAEKNKLPTAAKTSKKEQTTEKAQLLKRAVAPRPEWLKDHLVGDLNCGEYFIFDVEGADITMRTSSNGKLSKPYYLRLHTPKKSAERFILFETRRPREPITSSDLNDVNCVPAEKFVTSLEKQVPDVPANRFSAELESATRHALDVLCALKSPQKDTAFELTAVDQQASATVEKLAVDKEFEEVFGSYDS